MDKSVAKVSGPDDVSGHAASADAVHSDSPRPTAIGELTIRPQRVLCPCCHYIGYTAVPASRSRTFQMIAHSASIIIFTGGLAALAFPWWLPIVRDCAAGYAAHFCSNCGVHLAYWSGDTTHVFAEGDYLATASIQPTQKGEDPVPGPISVRSPLGAPPLRGSGLYARYIPDISRDLLQLRVIQDTNIKGFPGKLVHRETLKPLFLVKTYSSEHRQWYDEGDHFLPIPVVEDPHESWRSSSGSIYVSTAGSRGREVARLDFWRDNCHIRVSWTTPTNHRPYNNRVGVDNLKCITQRPYLPFLSSAGPMVWTHRKGLQGPVLLDAYDRVVAYGELNICDKDTTPEVLADIVVTYIALRVQTKRYIDYKAAENAEYQSRNQ
ncbi:hypothetical protein F4803DRAFT_524503 [Xylaria telfairii]|nr:hypothetical protein F4803DRAFT_524503 [Xylaria telfairii]